MNEFNAYPFSILDRLLILFTVVFVCIAPAHSLALPVANIVPPCRCQNDPLQSNRDLIHKVMQIGDADRMTTEEFAADSNTSVEQVNSRFASVGKLNCGKLHGTAQVTLKNNVITTAAHVFEGDCKKHPPVNPESCVFSLHGRDKKYRVKKAAFHGGRKCPRKSADTDWAVLVLEENVDSVKPLDVDFNASSGLVRDGSVLALGHSIDFFRQSKGGRWVNPRHVGRCKVRDVYVPPSQIAVAGSDCDLAKGSSGGPLLSLDQANPKLQGVQVGSSESEDQINQAVASRSPLQTVYDPNASNGDPDRGYATAVLVSGEFAEALRKVQAGNY
jgi:hypothetical protein